MMLKLKSVNLIMFILKLTYKCFRNLKLANFSFQMSIIKLTDFTTIHFPTEKKLNIIKS